MYKICIVDHEETSREQLGKFFKQYKNIRGEEFEVRLFANATSYLSINDGDSSIIIIDVDIPGTNGMEIVKKIRETRPEAIIIFCTKFQHFAVRGYEVDAFGFIPKPVQWDTFRFFIDKAIGKLNPWGG